MEPFCSLPPRTQYSDVVLVAPAQRSTLALAAPARAVLAALPGCAPRTCVVGVRLRVLRQQRGDGPGPEEGNHGVRGAAGVGEWDTDDTAAVVQDHAPSGGREGAGGEDSQEEWVWGRGDPEVHEQRLLGFAQWRTATEGWGAAAPPAPEASAVLAAEEGDSGHRAAAGNGGGLQKGVVRTRTVVPISGGNHGAISGRQHGGCIESGGRSAADARGSAGVEDVHPKERGGKRQGLGGAAMRQLQQRLMQGWARRLQGRGTTGQPPGQEGRGFLPAGQQRTWRLDSSSSRGSRSISGDGASTAAARSAATDYLPMTSALVMLVPPKVSFAPLPNCADMYQSKSADMKRVGAL